MIKRLLKEVKEYKAASILTPIFMIGEVIFETLIPFIMGLIINNGINGNNGKGDTNYIVMMGVIMFVFALLGLVAGMGGGIAGEKASTGFAKNLREAMFRNIQTFSFANIDKFSTSGLVTRMTTDVTNVQNAYQMLIRVAVRAPIMMIFAMIMSFTINVKISLIFLATIPVLGFILIWLAQHVHPYFERVFNTYDRLNEVVQENLHGVRVVKSFIREPCG